MSESEREGEEGGAASGAQGDEEREGGENEGGGGAGEEREERAGNAEMLMTGSEKGAARKRVGAEKVARGRKNAEEGEGEARAKKSGKKRASSKRGRKSGTKRLVDALNSDHQNPKHAQPPPRSSKFKLGHDYKDYHCLLLSLSQLAPAGPPQDKCRRDCSDVA